MLARHVKVHGALFNRAQLDLGGEAERFRAVEDLLREGENQGAYPAALLEKLYDVCRYTVISSSGELPPGGKGLWIGQWMGPWNTTYTLDANVEMEVASMLSANMPELMESLFGMMMNPKVMADFRTNARKIMGCRGILVPQTMWPDCGLCVAWGPNSSAGQWWTAGGAWLASIFYDYYRYTGDRKFLKDRLLPFMTELALFYEDFLFVDQSGKYRFSPGWSPENLELCRRGRQPDHGHRGLQGIADQSDRGLRDAVDRAAKHSEVAGNDRQAAALPHQSRTARCRNGPRHSIARTTSIWPFRTSIPSGAVASSRRHNPNSGKRRGWRSTNGLPAAPREAPTGW